MAVSNAFPQATMGQVPVPETLLQVFWRRYKRNRMALVGLVLVLTALTFTPASAVAPASETCRASRVTSLRPSMTSRGVAMRVCVSPRAVPIRFRP